MNVGLSDAGFPASPGAAALPSGIGTAPFALRVAVIHGNRLSTDLLSALCVSAWRCEVVVNESANGTGLAAAERAQPDLIILGHHLPLIDCTELLPALRRAVPAAKIVVAVQQLNEYLVHRLLALHVHAVVEENSEGIGAMREAIDSVRNNNRCLSPRFVHLAARLRSHPEAFSKLLSIRQEQVLICVAHAMSDEETGRALGMNTATAKRHRADIADKLNLRSTPQQLIRYGMEKGFNSVALPAPKGRAP